MTVPPTVEWHPFDYDKKKATAPDHGDLVWIVEDTHFTEPVVDLGYFDGFTFVMWQGEDDCHVTHWAEIDHPNTPSPA